MLNMTAVRQGCSSFFHQALMMTPKPAKMMLSNRPRMKRATARPLWEGGFRFFSSFFSHYVREALGTCTRHQDDSPYRTVEGDPFGRRDFLHNK